jgi:signal transduction histidine kinase
MIHAKRGRATGTKENQFSPVGGTVRLRLHSGEGGIVIEVADNGPSIAPNERDAVFQRFHRGDRSRGTAGSGLGLALVGAIAELHSFTVSIGDAAPGCIFRLAAPAAAHSRPS